MGDLAYLWAPLLACVVITLLLTYFGIHVLARGVIFVDLALAQIAALGTTYAFFLGYDPRGLAAYLLSLLFTVFGAAVFSVTRHRGERIPQEAVIGITYAVATGASILLVDAAKDPHGGERIRYLLVGMFPLVRWSEVGRMAAICVVVGLIQVVWRRRFLEVTFKPGAAFERGMPVRYWDFIFYLTFGLAISSIVRLAGVLLVFSFLIVPAACGALFAQRLPGRLAIGWVVGGMVSLAGLLLSYDRPGGPMIVTLFGAVLIALAVLRYVTSSDRKGRALGRVAAGAAVVGIVFGSLHFVSERDSEHHHQAESAHGERGGGSLEDALARLASANPLERETALSAVEERGGLRAVPGIRQALEKEQDEGLRLLMAMTLARLGEREGIHELIHLLRTGELPFLQEDILAGLRETTGVDAARDREDPVKAWYEWWHEHGERARWDPQTRSYQF